MANTSNNLLFFTHFEYLRASKIFISWESTTHLCFIPTYKEKGIIRE